jgi:hypothetical protein
MLLGRPTVVAAVEEKQSGEGEPAMSRSPMFTKSIAELSDIADKLGVPLEALVATLRSMR